MNLRATPSFFVSILLLAAFSACADQAEPADAGGSDDTIDRGRRAPPDVGGDPGGEDIRATDVPIEDLSPADGDAPSDLGEAVDCSDGLTLAPFTLSEDYCIVARFPRPTSTALSEASAFAMRGSDFWSFHEDAGNQGIFFLQEWRVEGGAASIPSEAFGYVAPVEDKTGVIAGTYLTVSRDGQIAVGWRDDITTDAEVVVGVSGGEPEAITGANFNTGFAFLTEDDWLISSNGIGLNQPGPGLYLIENGGEARRMVTGMGALTAGLLQGDDVIFARWTQPPAGESVAVFSTAEVQAAVASSGTIDTSVADMVDTAGDYLFEQGATSGNDLILTRLHRLQTITEIVRYDVLLAEDTAAVSEGVVIASAEERGVGGLIAADGERIAVTLRTSDGWDIALIQPRL